MIGKKKISKLILIIVFQKNSSLNIRRKSDHSKLMVVNKETGEIQHRKFYNIVDYMRKNDLLVVNNTKVFPARLFATKDRTDAKVEVFL